MNLRLKLLPSEYMGKFFFSGMKFKSYLQIEFLLSLDKIKQVLKKVLYELYKGVGNGGIIKNTDTLCRP